MDTVLNRLGDAPLPDALGEIDDAVMAAFAADLRDRAAIPRILSAAALLALGLGYASGSISGTAAQAAPANALFAATALAPSTLLDPR